MRRRSKCWNVWRCAAVSTVRRKGCLTRRSSRCGSFMRQALPETHPTAAEIAATLPQIGFQRVTYNSEAVILSAGMALTLNGIAQGFIADKVAELLTAEGLTDILINTGEFRALGQMPGAAGWPVKLISGGEVGLAARALATSSPLGTVFDAEGRWGISSTPSTGLPPPQHGHRCPSAPRPRALPMRCQLRPV